MQLTVVLTVDTHTAVQVPLDASLGPCVQEALWLWTSDFVEMIGFN